jgi:SPP1 family predicted phage head-tail adaptor
MIRAGNLRHSVIIQSSSQARSTTGGFTLSWATVDTVWAGIRPLKGSEVVDMPQVKGTNPVEITIRYDPDITMSVGYRILRGSQIYDINAVVNVDERDHTWKLYCTDSE